MTPGKDLTILYRGPLVSCNYGCAYCPFAKRKQTRDELAQDKRALVRFVTWVRAQTHRTLSILVTPWGEGPIRTWYQDALCELSGMPHVKRVVIQTNLSCRLDWLERANPQSLALWCTYHPEWTQRESLLQKCSVLDAHKIRYSVGVVGFARFRNEIEMLRRELPPHVYVWINAVKRDLDTLSPEDRAFFAHIDPLYPYNTHHYPSQGKPCRAGTTAISVDGEGTMRRCHFIPTPIGNIYDAHWERALTHRFCTQKTCHCYIGYMHLEYVELPKVFGSGILERIPESWPDERLVCTEHKAAQLVEHARQGP